MLFLGGYNIHHHFYVFQNNHLFLYLPRLNKSANNSLLLFLQVFLPKYTTGIITKIFIHKAFAADDGIIWYDRILYNRTIIPYPYRISYNDFSIFTMYDSIVIKIMKIGIADNTTKSQSHF